MHNHDQLMSRLDNWKFTQALTYLDGAPEEVRQLVEALARLVGDCGWHLEGDLATVIDAALDRLPLWMPLPAERPTHA